jgi:Bifunctional DNA primase/polymerase, N-terminal
VAQGDGPISVFALRRQYWKQGYRPLEVWGPNQLENDKGEPLNKPGKQPRGRWREDASFDPPETVRIQPDPRALNTGLMCGEIVSFDVDVLDPALVDRIVALIEGKLGPTPLVRIGRAPKTLLVYRPEEKFRKIETREMFSPDGAKAQIELLAEGQQFVADGVHPETGQPYRWTDRTPADFPLNELPVVSEAAARAIIAEVEQILRDAGAVEKEKPQKPARHKLNGAAGGFFSQVNSAALSDIAAWAVALFPKAKIESTGAWRVSSGDLGRELEEDISIHPEGIRDFGEEVPLSAIDLVMRHHCDAQKALDAALWICERLNIDPHSLGYISQISLDDFYAYMPNHEYIFVPTREVWPAASVDSRLSAKPKLNANGNQMVDSKGKFLWIKPTDWLDLNRSVEQMTWCPGHPLVISNKLVADGGWIDRRGVKTFNLYREPIIEPGDPAAVQPWLDLVYKVYPDDAQHIIFWLAHRVQRPAEKIHHALLLGGVPGIGKDSIVQPVKSAVGPWNFQEVTPQQLMGRFNGFLKCVILRISEARDLGEFDRFKFYEHLKVYTAAPPDVLRVDEKNLREHSIFNVCGVVITTNYKVDGIYLPPDDRRHYVAWSDVKMADFESNHWSKLYRWYDSEGAANVAAYLRQLDISAFDPKAPPPKTAAFWDIVQSSQPPEDAELADALDKLKDPLNQALPKVVTIGQLVGDNSYSPFSVWLLDRRNSRVIPHRFEKCGYSRVRNEAATDGQWKVGGKRQAIYGRTDLSVRERYEAATDLVAKLR